MMLDLAGQILLLLAKDYGKIYRAKNWYSMIFRLLTKLHWVSEHKYIFQLKIFKRE
jgi:hypothetical protein